MTSAACANDADKVRSVTSYGPQAAGTANNLLPLAVTQGSGAAFAGGDTANLATTSLGYDAIGNVTSGDGPLTAVADVTTYRYDTARRLAGVVSPDPGGLPRQAVRLSYNADGQPTLSAQGTVTGADDAAWANFVSRQQSTASYDASGRKTQDVVTAGGTRPTA